MALRYFVDGYNVIRSVDWLSQGALRDQRNRLIRFIEEKRPQGSANNQVTVVFDGRADVSSPPVASWVRVVFADGEADGVIKDRVDNLAQPRSAVVVTNDRAIQKWVRGVGAKIMSCEAFLSAGTKGSQTRPSGGGLDAEAAQDINEELKRLWKLK